MEQGHREMRDERGLLRWFCQNGITSSQCGADLACENCQREVPWGDACKGADGCIVICAFCIIAQEINGFTKFTDAIEQGLACFARKQCEEFAVACFE